MSSDDLPPGWTMTTVESVGRVDLGRQRSPEHHRGPNMKPYLRVANVYEDRIDISDVMEMNFSPPEAERFGLSSGDILLNEGQSKELIGRPAMYRNELPGACFTNSLVRFRAHSCVDPTFALRLFIHYMKSGIFQSIASVTTNIAHLGAGRFAKLPFPLPPLIEQRRIVSKLEELLARSRRAKDALDAIPPLLEKLRQSILATAFRGDLTADWRAKNPDVEPAEELLKRIRIERRKTWEEAELAKLRAKGQTPADHRWKAKYKEPEPVDTSELPELPDGWCWACLDEVVRGDVPIAYGIVQPGKDEPHGVPVVRAKDIQDGAIVCEGLSRTALNIAAAYERTTLEAGDVLLCIIRDLRVAVVPHVLAGGNIVRGIVRLAPSRLVLSGYLAAYLSSPAAQDSLMSNYRGIDMPVINVKDVRRTPVAVAPLLEQEQIERRLNHSLRSVERMSKCGPSRSLVEQLERALLTKAFQGELVEQDPNDEPASAMLERLAAERQAAQAAPASPERSALRKARF